MKNLNDQHILNKCRFNEGLMIKRHDHLERSGLKVHGGVDVNCYDRT